MNALLVLWLPILLSAVAVFIISSLVHMVFKWHASDYTGFSNEDAVRDAIRAGNPAPGRYVIPHCTDMKDMEKPEMQRKYEEGPIGHVVIGPNGMPNIGKFLGQWFVWTLVVSVVAGFLASQIFSLDPSRARAAAKLVGAVSFIGYGFGTITESIWGMRPWGSSAKYLLDAALYGIGAGLVFFWLWPK